MQSLLTALHLTPAAIRFQRDDPKTTKACPGRKITKEAFIAQLGKV